MMIIGVDYHPSDQYIAFADTETGECGERRLNHSDGEAEKFYRDLQQRAASVRVGMEATGYSRWFERLLAELGIEVWIGDAAKIKTKRVRKQKTDRNDAQLLLTLLIENNFPRVWVHCRSACHTETAPEFTASKATRCCAICWERRHRQRCVVMRTGVVGTIGLIPSEDSSAGRQRLGHITCTWRCAEKKTSPRWPWPEESPWVVLDVAERLGVWAVGRVRLARGTARNRTWRALGCRPLDWASRSLAEREFERVIMVEV
jgi:hypothetical protein